MKRTIANANEVSKHYSILTWHKCHFCEQEFRRESGYKWSMGFYNRYSCTACVASVSHCNDMIEWKRDSWYSMLLKEVPPAPPMRTFRNK